MDYTNLEKNYFNNLKSRSKKMIIWLTGQPGSGKTTLSKRVY